MQRILVTPAGRREYLSILFKHLRAQKHAFDEWRLWLNTTDAENIAYCEQLAAANDWITTAPLSVPYRSNFSICSFFPTCVDPNALYLRLDDDIVWMEPNYIDKMFAFRAARPDYFLVFGNIVNNAVITHIQQRMGAVAVNRGVVGYDTFDHIGWVSGPFAEFLHLEFLRAIAVDSLDAWRGFAQWDLFFHERCSINSISWRGETFAKFNGQVGIDEEQWLSHDHPKHSGQFNVINGQALCAHFAFHTQRAYLLENATDVLGRYAQIADSL